METEQIDPWGIQPCLGGRGFGYAHFLHKKRYQVFSHHTLYSSYVTSINTMQYQDKSLLTFRFLFVLRRLTLKLLPESNWNPWFNLRMTKSTSSRTCTKRRSARYVRDICIWQQCSLYFLKQLSNHDVYLSDYLKFNFRFRLRSKLIGELNSLKTLKLLFYLKVVRTCKGCKGLHRSTIGHLQMK